MAFFLSFFFFFSPLLFANDLRLVEVGFLFFFRFAYLYCLFRLYGITAMDLCTSRQVGWLVVELIDGLGSYLCLKINISAPGARSVYPLAYLSR